MILIAVGANLPGPTGSPLAQCEAALQRLASSGVAILARSPWYESAPVPPSDQPWYVNGVVSVATSLPPATLLETLHRIERALGRTRGAANAARTIDLDLLDYDGLIRSGPEPPILPHPRLAGRAFVLRPLADVAPEWRHPRGSSVAELLAALPPDANVRPLPAAKSRPNRFKNPS
ncbi:MAG TPA: 2-amino-4-hydroxy-6-hydroxymethyldihydropteridine diphosphokinase [Sinorhizobium sp.]|nr:2-amino-4-hydroxy-6-hydroxymethyldihydropteridine diphosphokinase [Sinorhizobium sp.]